MAMVVDSERAHRESDVRDTARRQAHRQRELRQDDKSVGVNHRSAKRTTVSVRPVTVFTASKRSVKKYHSAS